MQPTKRSHKRKRKRGRAQTIHGQKANQSLSDDGTNTSFTGSDAEIGSVLVVTRRGSHTH